MINKQNVPEHATHYRVTATGDVIYYNIDNAIFKYQDETWIEIEEPVDFGKELKEL